jgi:hypothetical protein
MGGRVLRPDLVPGQIWLIAGRGGLYGRITWYGTAVSMMRQRDCSRYCLWHFMLFSSRRARLSYQEALLYERSSAMRASRCTWRV